MMRNRAVQTDVRDERQFLNILRGIAVYLMLWGHIIQYSYWNSSDFYENAVFKTIYSFHMPLFMLISGYLFYYSAQSKSLEELLVYKTQKLLNPIIMGTLLNWLLTSVFLPIVVSGAAGIKTLFYAEYMNQFGTFTFLWSVLASTFVVSIAVKATSNNWIKALLLTLGLVVVAVFPGATFNLYLYPFYVIGYCYSGWKNKEIKRLVSKIGGGGVSLVAFPVMLRLFESKHYIYTTGLHFFELDKAAIVSIDLFRWAIGLVGSVFVITCLTILLKSQVIKRTLTSLFNKLGRKSMQIYVLQTVFITNWYRIAYTKLCEILGENILLKSVPLFNFILSPCISVLAGCFLLLLISLLEKSKISKILFAR